MYKRPEKVRYQSGMHHVSDNSLFTKKERAHRLVEYIVSSNSDAIEDSPEAHPLQNKKKNILTFSESPSGFENIHNRAIIEWMIKRSLKSILLCI